jgi:hypothetical protein
MYESILGSPNIFLRKNFERKHIYKGVYIIKDYLKDEFQEYKPVPHLKISFKLFDDIIKSLNDLSRISKSDEEECEMFVDAMEEYFGIVNLVQADLLANKMNPIYQYGAYVLFISNSDVEFLKSCLKAYKKLYEWSVERERERREDYYDKGYGYYPKEPYYSHNKYLQISILAKNLMNI